MSEKFRYKIIPCFKRNRVLSKLRRTTDKKINTLLQNVKVYLNNGGEGEIWTLAPVTRPTPLAGAPLRPTWVLLHGLPESIKLYFSIPSKTMLFSISVSCIPCYEWDCGISKKWRRGWDSNSRLLRVTGFQDQLLKPLGHLSEYRPQRPRFILAYPFLFVNRFSGNDEDFSKCSWQKIWKNRKSFEKRSSSSWRACYNTFVKN